MTFAEGLRIVAAAACLFSPPILVLLAIIAWIRKRRSGTNVRTHIALALILVSTANWATFAVLFSKSLTPYGRLFQTSLLTHALLLISILSMTAPGFLSAPRWRLLIANLLLTTLWVGIAYAPSHYLKRWDYGNVTIDGHPTTASVYIANPWDTEADAVVLVHTPATGDFLLSFGQEKVHITLKHRYLRVPGGVWSFPSLREMTFDDPLPSTQMNEFRFKSTSGSVVSVQF